MAGQALLAPVLHPTRAVTVAFATEDGVHVDAELRTASRLDVYEITAAAARLLRSCSLLAQGRSGKARLEALAGVDLVFVRAIGPSGAARLAARGIRAATSHRRAPIEALVALLRGGADAWCGELR